MNTRNKFIFRTVFFVTVLILFYTTAVTKNHHRVPDFLGFFKLANPRYLSVKRVGERSIHGSHLSMEEQSFKNLKAQLSDFDDTCPSSVERGEWLQYYMWFSKQVDMTPDDDIRKVTAKYNNSIKAKQKVTPKTGMYTKYSHMVTHHIIDIDNSTETVKLLIREQKDKRSSDCGSSFRVNAGSAMHSQVCPVKDYLNGTYMSCCTIDTTYISDQYQIKINLQFAGFNAFSTRASSNNQEIWSKQFSLKRNSSSQAFPTYQDCVDVEYLNTEAGYWIKQTSNHQEYNQYVLEDSSAPGGHCIFHVMDPHDLSLCFEKKFNHTFTLIGDSHIRYAFYHLINLSTGSDLSSGGHEDIQVTTHYFKWKPYCKDLVEGLKSYLAERHSANTMADTASLPNYHLLILDSGQWDLRDETAQSYLSCIGFYIYPLVRQIQMLPRMIVIWQDLPPLPDVYPMEGSRTIRNNFLVAAMNYFTRTLMEPVITASIPTRSISLAWSEKLGAMRSQLMDMIPIPGIQPATGKHPTKLKVLPPGHVVTNLLAYHACKDS